MEQRCRLWGIREPAHIASAYWLCPAAIEDGTATLHYCYLADACAQAMGLRHCQSSLLPQLHCGGR